MTESVVLGTISLNDMAGGLEKNIVLLANYLAEKGLNVNLISFDFPDATSFYQIDPRVIWHKVGNSQPHAPISFYKRMVVIGRIRGILNELGASTVICFHHGILFRFLLASILIRTKYICSERNSLSLYKFIKQSKWSHNFLLLSFVNKITVQFSGYRDEYPFWLRKRIRVISNPVYPAKQLSNTQVPNENGRYILLTVGRLCAQKNQRDLIEAFASLSVQFMSWDLYIVGDGASYDYLKKIIVNHSLQGRVFLVGKSNDVSSWLIRSHIFCLPSQWEGFPNALAEAMACGLPSIGYISCAGVRDLIEHGVTGLLSKSGELAKSLEVLMSSDELRKKMGDAAVSAVARYAPDNTFKSWDKVLAEIS